MATTKKKEKLKKLIAILEDQGDIDIVKKVLKGIDIESGEVLQGGIREAIKYFGQNRSPEYLIIDISKSDLPISDLLKLSEICEPGVNVLAIGNRNDVVLYRDLIKLGIHDYLIKPLFADIVSRSLKNMVFGSEGEKISQAKSGKIITLLGARGGVGTSYIANTLASIMAIERSRRVILVDLDIHFGTTALYFNLRSNDGLNTALEDPERIDQLFLERLFNSVNERLYVLSSEIPLDDRKSYTNTSLEQLLSYLTKLFHYVMIDIPHNFNEIGKYAMDQSNVRLVITEASLAGLRDSGRIFNALGEDRLDHRLMLVLNKYIKNLKGVLNPEDFEGALKREVNHIIPYNESVITELAEINKVTFEAKSPLISYVRKIADDIQGLKTTKEEEKSFWGFFKK
ncbi:MAG: hypothetical protein ACD_16C00192G0013 [uncultured bacterium]|nr:MAG: hypothetical protein ACD_16C00192G0013 [uncultured bacterium]OFW68167.1 MAG: hypothetical protein A2X70_05680 [Alphaproteobacteria bacterium GWC2_42_16]OFW73560.1 MAG: hypothetical protein A2Z80_06980 [Alphaproteobacteria bacterium GWA2_41_27]OFW82409.1 MAG: hypothetical protein A3E50_04380 [Alphaproteobacteria bacterium RIFCSPHIGHO2_12_FULL_42_100]OFW86234.1 MAG: hypothetical protein A2W06_01310 [Alphaproteobacteria bacterium RBG_16_42_14]OFW91793.1 MAG: hypothetical protein A3C41_013